MTQTSNFLIDHLSANQNQPEVTVNAALDSFDVAGGSVLTHAVATDGDYTLATGSSPPEWLYHVVRVTDTGAVLTTGRNIVVPGQAKPYGFRNDSGQTLKIKTATGLGVPVAAAKIAMVHCDGTDVFRVSADVDPQST